MTIGSPLLPTRTKASRFLERRRGGKKTPLRLSAIAKGCNRSSPLDNPHAPNTFTVSLPIARLTPWPFAPKALAHRIKDFKKYSDNVKDVKFISEEIQRKINYKHMRIRIKPVSDRLSPSKQLELNRALDFDYKEETLILVQDDVASETFVEGEWPKPMRKSDWDSVFKKLEGLKWLKLDK